MKTLSAAVLVGVVSVSASCTDFLNVNTNPNGPQSVSANLYLPPMLHWMVTSPQFDGRFVGHYAQEWISTSTLFSPAQSWGRMGYDPASDNGGQQWRDVYWSLGQNLIAMNAKATAEQRWDLLGVGLILKAWGWQVLTDLHGEIIIKEALDVSRTSFDYDTQEYAYQEVQRLLDSAIVLLRRTDGAVDASYLAKGDHIYNGSLMNGTQFGGVVDPRMSRMLAIDSANTTYRGLDINVLGFGALTPPQQPRNFFGYVGSDGLGLPSRYLFADRSKIPVMTYSELQFVKAEAALRMGNQAAALTAYTNGISSHIDFVNARNLDAGQTPTQITGTEKATFLADPAIVPATLTLSHVMSQKYIALWGWGHNELWMDMRRYHYTDIDPVSGTQVFRGFTPPTNLSAANGGKVAQRIRPRYNSEYVWNVAALQAIGADATDYHTKPLWIIQP
ncbi:MAG: SusD/RagB family nutrient-binding outer membrane lipoprotein [Gemmatimonadetes bacterium]|nr:MAG: SusD/RagB family nutrient-binding outer membrane lipoprotein [Gemmatimonadota bacterium]